MNSENQFDLLRAVIIQIKIDDPGIKESIKQQIWVQKKRGNVEEISNEIIRRLRIQNKKLLELVSSLKDRLKQENTDKDQIQIKLRYLEKLNNDLAEALGSCSVCWGEDKSCKKCLGDGSPGWNNINKRMFNLYILPVLEKLILPT